MWIKLDDGFATHPKILRAGVEATVLQIRAICYASHNKTDGFIPSQAVQLFTSDLPIAPEGWATRMVSYGLWELDNLGYRIHDYLQWNISKSAFQVIKEKLSKAGRKGMKSRWNKEKSDITKVITQVNNQPRKVTSTATATLNSLNSLNSPDLKITKHSKSNGAHPIPDDWVPKESHQKLASARKLDLPIEAAHFRGKANELEWVTKNWDQKFTNWMLQEVKFRARRTT